MFTKEVGRICVMSLVAVLGLAMPGLGTLIDIAPHNVLPGGAVVDANSNTWTVTYSSIFDPYTATSLWDGYIGDQQHLDLVGPPPCGGGWLSANVAGPASIYIDMGTTYLVQQIKLWNFGGVNAGIGGFNSVKIYLGDTPNPTTEVASTTLSAGQAVGGQPYTNYAPEGEINLTPGVSGRYLTISGLTNYGWGELKGLSEIGVMVPEPVTFVILGLGLLMRRRTA